MKAKDNQEDTHEKGFLLKAQCKTHNLNAESVSSIPIVYMSAGDNTK